jgi:hypothetical protein
VNYETLIENMVGIPPHVLGYLLTLSGPALLQEPVLT